MVILVIGLSNRCRDFLKFLDYELAERSGHQNLEATESLTGLHFSTTQR
jgi:hypothetical protein